MGTSEASASSPRSSIMFLMSMLFSATCLSVGSQYVSFTLSRMRRSAPWRGIVPTVIPVPSLLTRVILPLSAIVKVYVLSRRCKVYVLGVVCRGKIDVGGCSL